MLVMECWRDNLPLANQKKSSSAFISLDQRWKTRFENMIHHHHKGTWHLCWSIGKLLLNLKQKTLKNSRENSDKTGSKFQGDFTSISASLWARRIFWEKMVTISLVPFWPRGRLMVLKVWKWLLLFFCFLWHDFALFHDLSTRWRLNHLTHLR